MPELKPRSIRSHQLRVGRKGRLFAAVSTFAAATLLLPCSGAHAQVGSGGAFPGATVTAAYQSVCAEDFELVREIPIKHTVGCESKDCCQLCPGPPDWRVRVSHEAESVSFRFQNLSPKAKERLKIEGNAKWDGDGRLKLGPGESTIRGFRPDSDGRWPTALASVVPVQQVETLSSEDVPRRNSPGRRTGESAEREKSTTAMDDRQVSNQVLLRIEEFGGSTVVSDLRISVSTQPCREGSATSVTPPGALAVGNRDTVTVYNKDRSGNLPPVRVIRGPDTQLEGTTNASTDGQGRLYVLSPGNYFTHHETAKVLVFDAGANGDAAPIRVITSPASIPEAICLAVDDSGQVFVGKSVLFGEDSFTGSVAVFAPGADGNSTPTQIITDGANRPFAIAVNRSGSKLYVANGEYGSPISIYEKNAAGRFLRTRTVSASNPRVGSLSLAVDTVGAVYVLTEYWPDDELKVLVFEPDTNRSLVESRQMTILTGPNRRLNGTEELVIGVDRLYVFVGGYDRDLGNLGQTHHVKVYNKFARGVTFPVRVIQGPRTELTYPSGIAFIP